MAFNPGRNVGRVSIRVIPDTTKFRAEAKRDLERIAKSLTIQVRLTGLTANRQQLQESLNREVAALRASDVDIDGRIHVSKADVEAAQVRAKIQEQIDRFSDFKVNLDALVKDREKFEREVRRMVNRAERNEIDIPVSVSTAIANARLAYASRTRMVELIVRVNKASLASAAASIAALSGARLTGQMLSDLGDFAKDLDKNLPSLLGWTTGLTSLGASLFAAASGIVGFGQGLVALAPSLLLVPGLVANATGVIIALVVALKNAKTELAPLGDSMRELGQIINGTFWDRARQPIIDLVSNLMPQLRDSFQDISAGLGDFTAEMSRAFGQEFANGRLASIFKNIADGWRILASGADGFAGAIVSLSEIAANYTPRLASWLVRQANTLDAWLTRVANDGRLDKWMQGAIDSAYALWDATTGLAGVFEGIWKAADRAGSGGLRGLADMLQAWKRVVNGSDFQRGLTAIFRGSYVAMEAFGDAVKSIGRLVAVQAPALERFIGSAGTALGGLVGSAADALKSQRVTVGLNVFSEGLIEALDRLKPTLQPIANTFGDLLGLLGGLAANLLPTAVGVVSDLTPAISGIIGAIEPALPKLSSAVGAISDKLAPAAADLVKALSPALTSALESFAAVAPTLADALSGFAQFTTPFATALSDFWVGWSNAISTMSTGDWSWLWNNDSLDKLTEKAIAGGGWFGDITKWATEFDAAFVDAVNQSNTWLTEFSKNVDDTLNGIIQSVVAFGETVSLNISQTLGASLANIGDVIANPFKRGFELVAAVMIGFQTGDWSAFWSSLAGSGLAGGQSAATASADGFVRGFGASRGVVTDSMTAFGNDSILGPLNAVAGQMVSVGVNTINGFFAGAQSVWAGVGSWFASLPGSIAAGFSNAGSLLWSAGSRIMNGFLSGLQSAWGNVQDFVGGIASWIKDNKGPAAYDRALLVPAGLQIMSGFQRGLEDGFSAVQSKVRGFTDAIRDEFGPGLSNDISSGIRSGMDAANAELAAASFDGSHVVGRSRSDGPSTVVNVTQPLLPGETPQEQRDNVIRELQWAL